MKIPGRIPEILFKGKRLYLTTLIVQVLLVIIGFNKIIFGGDAYVFKAVYDSLKNYYNFEAYILQPASAGYSLLTTSNYPFGESVYYMDITPVFAVPLRWVHLNLFDLHGLSIPIYQFYMISGVFLSSLMILLVLRQFDIRGLIAFIAALALPWIDPQMFRLPYGHFNLSFGWFIPATLLLTIYLVREFYGMRRPRRILVLTIVFILFQLFTAFNHLYYIPILGLVAVGVSGVFAIIQWRRWRQGIQLVLLVGFCVAVTAIATLQIIKATDIYLAGRATNVGGFAFADWNLDLRYLYSAYPSSTFRVPFSAETTWGHYEAFSYWGGGAIYALLFLAILMITRRLRGKPIRPLLPGKHGGLILVAMLVTGFVAICIAGGKYVQIGNTWYYNYLNPFLIIKQLYPPLVQFRALGRFSWISFWAVNLSVIWLISYVRKDFRAVLFVVWVFFTLADMGDRVRDMNDTFEANPFSAAHNQPLREIGDSLQLDKYDAMLSAPFIYVGPSNLDHTFEPDDSWVKNVMACSIAWDMPMMDLKGARTNEIQAEQLTAIFRGEPLPDELRSKLKGKRILLYMRNNSFENCEAAFKNGPAATELCSLPVVGATTEGTLYLWQP